jgi:hypothetical protein
MVHSQGANSGSQNSNYVFYGTNHEPWTTTDEEARVNHAREVDRLSGILRTKAASSTEYEVAHRSLRNLTKDVWLFDRLVAEAKMVKGDDAVASWSSHEIESSPVAQDQIPAYVTEDFDFAKWPQSDLYDRVPFDFQH